MPISTGDYFEHINDSLLKTTYYTFTPKPLMNNEFYTVDDELLSLIASTHKSLGILEGMSLYMPNQEPLPSILSRCVKKKIKSLSELENELLSVK